MESTLKETKNNNLLEKCEISNTESGSKNGADRVLLQVCFPNSCLIFYDNGCNYITPKESTYKIEIEIEIENSGRFYIETMHIFVHYIT